MLGVLRPELRFVRRCLSVLAVLFAVGATAASASSQHAVRIYSTHSTPPLRTALMDPHAFVNADRAHAFQMASGTGATYIRLLLSWKTIAPVTLPQSGFAPSDPSSPGYSWGALDSTMQSLAAAGLSPILDIVNTPSWAYAVRPRGVNAGTPKAAALREFATALATRYDGNHGLPAVHVFQVWDEPNLSLHLFPASAKGYRLMVNAVATGVHSVDPANLVVAGALDPFGHKKSKKQKWYSVAPLAFMRSLLCVSKGAHPHRTCHNAVHFDVWSHHPYTFGGPFGKSKVPDNIELGDLPRMRAVLKAGVRFHRVVSSRAPQFWVTEVGWDTNPPRRHAASLSLAARWTAESLYQMWRSGVSLATWFLLQDWSSPSPYQSGLYFRSSSLQSARAKPGLTAFRFPFVAYRGKKKTVSVWGRVATSDRELVTVQRRHGGSGTWRTVAHIRSNGYGIFKATLKLKAATKDSLRATTVSSGKSLAFSLKVPHTPNIGPWGN